MLKYIRTPVAMCSVFCTCLIAHAQEFPQIDSAVLQAEANLLQENELLREFTPEDSSSIFRLSFMGADDNSHFGLPIWGDKAREAGYEIPLPFGVGAVYTYVERDIKVDNIQVGINGAPLQNVDNFINLGSRSHVNVAVTRFDAFIFPFLNVYAMLGYVDNETTTKGEVTVNTPGPGPGTLSFPLKADTKLDGFVGGFGVTLAAGYKEVFASFDTNWSQVDLGFDDAFRANISTLRVGWNGKIQGNPVRLWTGGAYWNTASVASSTVQVPGVGSVAFQADQSPANPWNIVFGGQASINSNIDLFLELGTNFEDMKYIALGAAFRF